MAAAPAAAVLAAGTAAASCVPGGLQPCSVRRPKGRRLTGLLGLIVAAFASGASTFAARASLLTSYCLNVRIRVKPERRTDFLACIKANQQGTLKSEPLALEYLFGEDDTTPCTFHFHEQYRGREGFEAHTRAPHFIEWEEFASTDPFTEPPEVVFFNERGAPRPGKAADGKRYCVSVKMSIKPDRRDDFLICIAANRRGTLDAEPLALAYVFGEDENRPNTFHFQEAYEGREGFKAHTKTAHFASWEKFASSDPFSEAPEVAFWEEQ